MIVSQVIVIGLWCADAGAAVKNTVNPHAASIVPRTMAVVVNGLVAPRSVPRGA